MQGLSLPAPERFSGRLIPLPLPAAHCHGPAAYATACGSLPMPVAGAGHFAPSASRRRVLHGAAREESSPTSRGSERRVADMPEAASTRPRSPLSLNSDGERHPLENSLAVFTLVTGLIVFAVGWVVRLHTLASVLGIVSMLVGFYAQMISATRTE